MFHIARNQLRYELLSPDLVGKRVEFLRVELDAAGGDKPEPYAHEGEEYGIVIRGRIEVFVDGSTYVLGPGDSIFFTTLCGQRGTGHGGDDLGHCSAHLLGLHAADEGSERRARHPG